MIKILNIQLLFAILGALFVISCEKSDNVLPEDGDGNVYDTIAIGTQVWLTENLKTTKYYNGASIPLVRDDGEWASKTSAAYCWYDNHPDFKNTYGALYNWYTVDAGILCPLGYHVSTVDDWMTLIDYLGGEKVAGGKIKEVGLTHWQIPNSGATNESDFTARAGGRRYRAGNFAEIGRYGVWWTSSPSSDNDNNAWYITTFYTSPSIIKAIFEKKGAYSVRCIKDK